MQTVTKHPLSETGPRHRVILCALANLLVAAESVTADPPRTARIMTVPAMIQPSVSPGVRLTLSAYGFPTVGPYTFQWRLEGQDIPGAVTNILRLENITTANAGEYTVLVANAHGEALSEPFNLAVDPTFMNVPIPLERDFLYNPEWIDLNHDAWVDIIGVGRNAGGDLAWISFLNSRDGSFVRGWQEPFPGGQLLGYRGYGDYDNDGLPDAAIGTDNVPVHFYHNLGAGNLKRTWRGPYHYFQCQWADLDNDGYLDLLQLDPWGIAHLHLNDHDGLPFHLVTQEGEPGWALSRIQHSVSTAWGDYDNDGRLDLFVTGLDVPGRLFRNLGRGDFVATDFTGPSSPSAAAEWVDYDGDNDLDLVINFFLVPLMAVYRNEGGGQLVRMTDAELGDLVSDEVVASVGMSWGDYDNDGDLDVYRTELGPPPTWNPGTGHFYVNQGGGRFLRVMAGTPTTGTHGYGLAGWSDYDHDGFLDLLGSRTTEAGSCLYRNNLPNLGNGNHWLEVQCEGRVSNREAIGTKVRVKASIGGEDRWQLRQIMRSSCDGSLVAHFGLGDATKVDAVRVEWPSGIVQEFQDVAVDQFKTVKEPPRLVPTGPCQFEVKCWPGMQFNVEASLDLETWIPVGSVRNVNGTATYSDAIGAHGVCRFYRVVEP